MKVICAIAFALVLFCFAGCSEDTSTGPCPTGCTVNDQQNIIVWYKPADLSERKVSYTGTVPADQKKGYIMELLRVNVQPLQFVSGSDIWVLHSDGKPGDFEVAIDDEISKKLVLQNVSISILQGPGGHTRLYPLSHVTNGKVWFRVHPETRMGAGDAWIQTTP